MMPPAAPLLITAGPGLPAPARSGPRTGAGESPGRPLSIDLWCNPVAGGWGPQELETGLGGGEESLLLWGRALAERGHRVRVFHNGGGGGTARQVWGGVEFLPHARFDPFARRDVLVSWKSPHPWTVGATARVCIHWSSDVEPPWQPRWLERLDAFVVFGNFHRAALPWLPGQLARVIPLGVALPHLEGARAARVPNRALYASSPDRGLETLLKDWPCLRERHPGLTLQVCYGWKNLLANGGGNPARRAFKESMERLLRQEGVDFRGAIARQEMARAYWEAEYWMLPLNRAHSELFCLNAVKAMHCGAVGVVNRIGGLQDTVSRWIGYQDFLNGETAVCQAPATGAIPWERIIANYWEPLFKAGPCNS